jgi:hypothetical protein
MPTQARCSGLLVVAACFMTCSLSQAGPGTWITNVCVFIRSSELPASYGLERCCRLIPAKNAAKIDRVCVFC